MTSQSGQHGQQFTSQSSIATSSVLMLREDPSPSDSLLCNDMLMTEKFVSGTYDTAIFEFKDTAIWQTLNHIQKEEQEHGEGLSQYMHSKGMLL